MRTSGGRSARRSCPTHRARGPTLLVLRAKSQNGVAPDLRGRLTLGRKTLAAPRTRSPFGHCQRLAPTDERSPQWLRRTCESQHSRAARLTRRGQCGWWWPIAAGSGWQSAPSASHGPTRASWAGGALMPTSSTGGEPVARLPSRDAGARSSGSRRCRTPRAPLPRPIPGRSPSSRGPRSSTARRTSLPWPPRWARPGCCGSGEDPYPPG